MDLPIVRFEPRHLPAVARLCERVLHRPRTEAFLRWRYVEHPAQRGYLMMRGDECVAMVWAILRAYCLDGRSVGCMESFDWYRILDADLAGIGSRLTLHMMNETEPIFAIPGAPGARKLLPKLGWRKVADVADFALPLRGAAVAGALSRRLRVPRPAGRVLFDLAARPWFRPRRRRGPRGAEVVPVACPGDEILALYDGPTGYGTLPLPDLAQLRWMTAGFAGAGHFVGLYFTAGGRLRGWTLARVHASAADRDAAIVDAFAPRPDVTLYAWMISETVRALGGFRPVRVLAQASCPLLQEALRRNRFLETGSQPLMCWNRGEAIPAGPVHTTLHIADVPLLSYPETWWGPDAGASDAGPGGAPDRG